MKCEELRDSYELYALDALDREEQAEIDDHLARGCDACTQSVADAVALNAALLSLTEEYPPLNSLKHRILTGVGYEKPGWFWAGAFAAALMLIIALWMGVQERERSAELAQVRQNLLEVSGERDQLAHALQFLSDPDTRASSFGRGRNNPPQGYALVHQELGVMMIASNLPEAGSGKTYEMWVTPKGGSPRPAGLFQSDNMTALHILKGPIDTAMVGSVTVTVEPEAGSQAPTSMPLIVANFGG